MTDSLSLIGFCLQCQLTTPWPAVGADHAEHQVVPYWIFEPGEVPERFNANTEPRDDLDPTPPPGNSVFPDELRSVAKLGETWVDTDR